jgi:hypothetical protein
VSAVVPSPARMLSVTNPDKPKAAVRTTKRSNIGSSCWQPPSVAEVDFRQARRARPADCDELRAGADELHGPSIGRARGVTTITAAL